MHIIENKPLTEAIRKAEAIGVSVDDGTIVTINEDETTTDITTGIFELVYLSCDGRTTDFELNGKRYFVSVEAYYVK